MLLLRALRNTELHKILEDFLVPRERYSYGFANLQGLLPEKFNSYPYGISIGRRLDDRIVDEVKNGPTEEYLEHYLAVNRELQGLCDAIAMRVAGYGMKAVAVATTVSASPEEFDQSLPDLRYEVSHKMVATRAGLGWIGKTDLFVSRKFGTRLRLSSILFDAEVQPEQTPIDRSRCGKCNICVEKCPAGAATGQLWDIHTDRDVFFDAFTCRNQCSEFGKTLHVDRRICGICVAVCPIGR